MKRPKPSTDGEACSSAETPVSPRNHREYGLLPALGAALGGLLAAAVLLWFGIVQDSRQQHAEQLAQAWGGSHASVVQQILTHLQQNVRRAAQNPALLSALQARDAALLRKLEQDLSYQTGIVDVHINQPGQAVQDAQRPAPINFAALDLLSRVERGENPAPEAYRVGSRWLIYSAAAVRSADDQPAQGTLLLAVNLQQLLKLLPPVPAGFGQLQVLQQFENNPPQLLASLGEAGSDATTLHLPSTLPNWKFSFTPGTALDAIRFSPLLMVLTALLALGGSLLGILLMQRGLQRQLRHDVGQLQQMLSELASGKSVKAFSFALPELDGLALALARLPQPRKERLPRREVPAETPPAPAFQHSEILDIDIVDENFDLSANESNPSMNASHTHTAPALPASIFRAYDIRGVVGDTLTADYAYWIGRAIGSQSLAQGEPSVVVGRDGRLSGPELSQALIRGLLDCGCQVTDIGMVPTPVLYFATNVLQARSGVMVTGSHNPPDYNGFKIVIAGDTLANESITALNSRLQQQDLASGSGSLAQLDILDRYFEQIRGDIRIERQMKVVVDCGNGVAGVIAPRLIEALGCQVIPLYCEVDGNFPNHHPDPGKLENLHDLIARVHAEGADLGLAFDGDGDRVGVVTNSGNMVYPDRLMMLFAKDVIGRNPGAEVIFDVKCTRRLGQLIASYGGRPLMWKTGHSLIKKKMKETGALLAGEMSGHIFFKERWFGFDDGIYSAARLLEILSLTSEDAESLFAAFPTSLSTPEINIEVTDERKFQLIERLQRDGQWGAANLTTLDGVRVDFPHGWGLVRASNTTPVLVLRFEADTADELARIQAVFRAQLQQFAPDLQLPF